MKRVLLVLTPFTSSCMPSQCQCVYDNNTHRNNIAAGRRHFVCVSFLQTLHVTIYLMYVCWLSVWLRLALLTASLITSLTASRVRVAIEGDHRPARLRGGDGVTSPSAGHVGDGPQTGGLGERLLMGAKERGGAGPVGRHGGCRA